MSNSIDSKVVEMKFDNRDFEANVKNTMSTLDKLKDKLKFKGAEAGLTSIQKVSDKIDFSGVANGLDIASIKFSAFQVAGITAISNITNSLLGLSKNIVNTFAIEPRTQGFDEYELKMGSVQNIMNATGASVEEVGRYLDELNTYADKTIYSFSDMTANIGKFTNAGVGLDKAVAAIQGISNEAAISGANANEASRAMYNFAQALSQGSVKLIDWKSIELANMATVDFKNQLIQTAVAMGTLVEQNGKYISTTKDATGHVSAAFDATSMFNDALSSQWLTTDVLVTTLGRYADETTDIGKKAFAAAKDVKTFSMMWDTLKESAGSGWAQTFELIFGNFEEAKTLWTGLTDVFSGVIDKISTARNTLVKGAMQGSWGQFVDKITAAGISLDSFKSKLTEIANAHGIDLNSLIEKYGSFEAALSRCDNAGALVSETLKNLVDASKAAGASQEDYTQKLKSFQDTVGQVWNSDLKTSEERYQALTDAGYDYSKVQDLVNKTVKGHALTLESLSDEQLKSIGYTQEEVDKLRVFSDEAQKTGSSLSRLISSLGSRGGRDLIFNQTDGIIMNFVNSLLKLAEIGQKAFEKLFQPIEASQIIDVLSDIQQATAWVFNYLDSHSEAMSNTLAGLLAPLKLISSILSGTFTVALKLAAKIIGKADGTIFDLTGTVGNAIAEFTNFITSAKVLGRVFDTVYFILSSFIDIVSGIVSNVKNFVGSTIIVKNFKKAFDSFKPTLSIIKKLIDNVADGTLSLKEAAKRASQAVDKWYDSCKPLKTFFSDLGGNISDVIEPLKKFMEQLIPFDDIDEKVKKAKESLSGLLDDLFGKSDSTKGKKTVKQAIDEVATYAKDYVAGLAPIDFGQLFQNGLDTLAKVKDRFFETMTGLKTDAQSTGNALTDFIQGINWKPLLSMAGAVGALIVIKKFSDNLNTLSKTIANVTKPFSTFDPLVQALSKTVLSFKSLLGGVKFMVVAQGILNLALAIGVMAIAIKLIGDMPLANLAAATAALGALIIAIGVVAAIASKVATPANSMAFASMGVMFAALGVMIGIIAGAIWIISSIDADGATQGVVALTSLMAAMTAMIATILVLTKKGGDGKALTQAGSMFTKLGIALLLMSAALAIVGSMSESQATQGVTVVGAMVVLIMGLIAVSNMMPVSKAVEIGSMFKSLGVALILMAAAVKLFGSMDRNDMDQGLVAVTALGLLFAAIIHVIASNGVALIGVAGTILAITVSIGLLIGISKLAAKLKPEEFAAGAKAIGIFGGMMAALVVIVTRYGGPTAIKIGGTVAALSIGIAALIAVAILCGYVDTDQLGKGVVAVGILGLMFAAIMKACNGMNENALMGAEKSIVAMAVVIVAMTACAIALGMMDTSKCVQGVVAVSAMGLVFAAMIKACEGLQNVKFGNVLTTVLLLTTVVVAMAGVIWAMSELNVQNALPNAVGLASLLLTFAASIKILSTINGDIKVSGKVLAEMVAITAALGVVLIAMSACNTDGAIENAIAVGILLNAFAASIKILSTINGTISISIPALVAMGAACVLLAVILSAMSALNVQDAIPNAIALSVLLLAFSAATAILAAIGPAAEYAIAGAAAMDAVIAIVAALLVSLGALTTNFPQLQEWLNTGIPVLKQIGEGLGEALGAFVGGALESFSDHLPDIATNLSNFFVNLDPTFTKIKQLSGMDFSGVSSLATALLTLTAADLLQGISNIGDFFTGDSPAKRMEKYADAMVKFADKASEINLAGMTKGAAAAPILKQVIDAMPTEGGLSGLLTGSQSEGIDNMSKALPKIADAAVKFGNSAADVNIEAIQNGVNAVKAISKIMGMDFPTEGGLAGMIFGSQSEGISNMSKTLVPLGEAAKAFGDATTGIVTDGVSGAISILNRIAKAAASDNLQTLQSNFSTAGLKTKFENLGMAAANFATMTTGKDYGSCSAAVDALNSVAKFIAGLTDFSGDGVTSFVSAVNELAKTNVAGLVTAFQNAGPQLTVAGSGLMQNLAAGVTAGSGAATSAVTAVVSNMVTSCTTAVATFGQSGTSAMTNLAAGINGSSGAPTSAVRIVVTTMISAASSMGSKFHNVGAKMMSSLASGIRSNSSKAKYAASSALNGVANTLRGYYDGFYSAGAWCAIGLAHGITSKTSTVTESARSIARAAVEAANKEAGVGSPAKKFITIGKWCVMGLAVGFKKNTKIAEKAGGDLSKAVVQTAQETMDLLNGYSNFKMGYASITPVIDSKNFGRYTGSLDLSANIGRVISEPIKSNATLMTETQKAIEVSNTKVLNAINELNDNLSSYTDAVANSETAMYVDGKKLASSIAKPMNQQLGVLSRRGGLA
nr:MAG TPA: tail tape measure [Caudoviricetes sp.]